MKLTSDLINESVSRINPLKDRELVLRDLKIPAIENLGATKDLNDTIDLTNNDLCTLGNFPRLLRLRHLLLANNRISTIEPGIEQHVPHLTTLILTNNAIQELGDLAPLGAFKKLTTLSLVDNPVTKKKHYRLYLIHKLPHMRVLDYLRVSQTERDDAAALFQAENGTDNTLAKSITDISTKIFAFSEGLALESKG